MCENVFQNFRNRYIPSLTDDQEINFTFKEKAEVMRRSSLPTLCSLRNNRSKIKKISEIIWSLATNKVSSLDGLRGIVLKNSVSELTPILIPPCHAS